MARIPKVQQMQQSSTKKELPVVNKLASFDPAVKGISLSKLSSDIILDILDLLDSTSLNAVAKTCRGLYNHATPILYRDIVQTSLVSTHLLFCTIVENEALAGLTRSLVATIPREADDAIPEDVRKQLRARTKKIPAARWSAAQEKLQLGEDSPLARWTGGPGRDNRPWLSSGLYQWDRCTAHMLVLMPNLQSLSLPRWYEIVENRPWLSTDRDGNVGGGLYDNGLAIAEIFEEVALEQRVHDEDYAGPLSKLKAVDLLPDHVGQTWFRDHYNENWRSPKAFTTALEPIYFTRPFMQMPSMESLKFVFDGYEWGDGFDAVASFERDLESWAEFRQCTLKHLEVTVRERRLRIPENRKILGRILEELGGKSLKVLKVGYFDEEVDDGAEAEMRKGDDKFVLPRHLCDLAETFTDSLQQLTLPATASTPEAVFDPLGHLVPFHNLRKLDGTMHVLLGRNTYHPRFGFGRYYAEEWLEAWAGNLPVSLKTLSIRDCRPRLFKRILELKSRGYLRSLEALLVGFDPEVLFQTPEGHMHREMARRSGLLVGVVDS